MPDTRYINKVVINGVTKIDLTADTIEADKILTGFTAHDRSGAPVIGTCSYDANTQDANAQSSEILANKTAYVAGAKVTGSMPNNGAVTGSIESLSGYTVPAGYHDGSGIVNVNASDRAKIIPGNIKSGVEILNVVGTYTGEAISAQTKNATPNFNSQLIQPDTGYDYLSAVNIAPITVTETENAQGGLTLTV